MEDSDWEGWFFNFQKTLDRIADALEVSPTPFSDAEASIAERNALHPGSTIARHRLHGNVGWRSCWRSMVPTCKLTVTGKWIVDWDTWRKVTIDRMGVMAVRLADLESRQPSDSGPSRPTMELPTTGLIWPAGESTPHQTLPSSPSDPPTTPTFRVGPGCECAREELNLEWEASGSGEVLWHLNCKDCGVSWLYVLIPAPDAPASETE
jgi:hypothetical protein